jgi:CubicO group peptidase (beta-lactamase class C family)
MPSGGSRSTRRGEEVLAILFGVAVLVAGGAGVYFVSTMSVHTEPAAVPSSPGTVAERYSGAIDEARRLARTLVVEDNLPGLSVAAAAGGRIVWAEAFGWADVERRVPMTPLTRLRIGSVSIPLAAAAVGVLYERGGIDLDAPVQRYGPASISTPRCSGTFPHSPRRSGRSASVR